MARLKLYYPADEITNNLYTTGMEYMTLDGVEYIGALHRYITSETYTESTWNSRLSQKLIVYVDPKTSGDKTYKMLKPGVQVTYLTPYGITPQPTKLDIAAGKMQRYFIKRKNDANILEVNLTQYSNWLSNIIDKKMYDGVEIKWYISGPIDNQHEHGVIVPGVITNNGKQQSFAARIIPELAIRLANPLELYTDTDFLIPVDINGLDS